MTQQHTAGPWFAAKDGWSNGTVTHNLTTGHIGQICHVQCTGAKTQSEGNANARLIAAAPELLAALQSVLTRQDWPVGTMKLKRQAEEAISKALNG